MKQEAGNKRGKTPGAWWETREQTLEENIKTDKIISSQTWSKQKIRNSNDNPQNIQETQVSHREL